MRQITTTLLIFPVLLILMFSVASAEDFNKEQLLAVGGKTLNGKVTKVGVYNFFIQTPEGELVNVHTDSGATKFEPEDERLMVGDTINVIYTSPISASNSTDKLMACYIDFIEKVPRQFLTDEMECIISFSQRNEKACYLPKYDKLVSFEGRWPGRMDDISNRPSVSSKVKIQLKAIPARIGNGYVYILKSASPL